MLSIWFIRELMMYQSLLCDNGLGLVSMRKLTRGETKVVLTFSINMKCISFPSSTLNTPTENVVSVDKFMRFICIMTISCIHVKRTYRPYMSVM